MAETMSLEEYPEDIEIKRSNFKTDQQEAAAETIAEEWPVDLDTLAEEGQHVEMFYSQVLDQFLGPGEADMTFSEIESEYGGVGQWADSDGDAESESAEEVAGVEGTDPETSGTEPEASMLPDAEDLAAGTEADTIDERQRAWFAAGFREGVEFALRNPDLVADRSEE